MNRNMRESGVDWIGKIPIDWEVHPLKHVLCERNEINNPVKVKDILSLTNNRGVIPYADKGDIGNRAKEDISGYKIVKENDIVINSMNLYIGSVGLSKYIGVVSPVYYMLYKRNDNDSIEYYAQLFQTKELQSKSHGYGNGILDIRMRIPMSNLNLFPLPVPPSSKQHKIISVLNDKVKRIDKLITIQERQLDVIFEYRRVLLTDIVTKGLDNYVPLIDTKIDWFGQIPSHWTVRKLKACLESKLQYGANSSGVSYDENLPRYIRITDITSDNELSHDNKLSLTLDQASGYYLKNGDVLFARSGATVGKSFIFKDEYGQSVFAGYLIKASVDYSLLIPEYLYYFTLSNSYLEWTRNIFIQATIQNIGASKYANMQLPLPPVNEQIRICKFIKNKEEKFKKIEKTIQAKIEKLNEYKKSLIYEYVTGKKEV
ncbi:MAG: restriction endonuclease subunit S [Ignavibacteriales bacterium]|jgi:type I restriction enzyme S subunit|nr:MAG: restriction endonuclease subunit S [Ignavibacteriales bacterium]